MPFMELLTLPLTDATREALSGGVARANRQPARVRSGRQGGGEACSTGEAG